MSLDLYLSDTSPYEHNYQANITHNLGEMARHVICFECNGKEITLYDILWHGSGLRGGQIISMLEVALKKLEESPSSYWEFTPKNGWGDIHNLISFTKGLLQACRDYPRGELLAHR